MLLSLGESPADGYLWGRALKAAEAAAVYVIVGGMKIDGLRKSRDLVLDVEELLLCRSGEAEWQHESDRQSCDCQQDPDKHQMYHRVASPDYLVIQ